MDWGSAEPQKQWSILSERFGARVFYRGSEEARQKQGVSG